MHSEGSHQTKFDMSHKNIKKQLRDMQLTQLPVSKGVANGEVL